MTGFLELKKTFNSDWILPKSNFTKDFLLIIFSKRSCLHGNEIKACVNLEKIYSDGLLGVENDKKREMKLESYQRKIEELSDDFELDIERVDDLARS